MRVTADTNIIVRAMMDDDAVQSPVAQRLLMTTELVAIPTAAMCEFAWVMKSTYKLSSDQIAEAIRRLTSANNIRFEPSAVKAGLSILDSGGDFADGAIAAEGLALDGITFASFDRGAVSRLSQLGIAASDPSDL